MGGWAARAAAAPEWNPGARPFVPSPVQKQEAAPNSWAARLAKNAEPPPRPPAAARVRAAQQRPPRRR